MNMLVMEHGPEISIPGRSRSAGTGGTRQLPLVTGLGARAGKIPCWSARWSTAARAARSAWTRGVNSSCRRTR